MVASVYYCVALECESEAKQEWKAQMARMLIDAQADAILSFLDPEEGCKNDTF